jgi:hypothetical protein
LPSDANEPKRMQTKTLAAVYLRASDDGQHNLESIRFSVLKRTNTLHKLFVSLASDIQRVRTVAVHL